MFLILIAMTDIPLTASIAAGFAWVIFIAMLLKYGPDASTNIKAIASPTTKSTLGGDFGGGSSGNGNGGSGGVF